MFYSCTNITNDTIQRIEKIEYANQRIYEKLKKYYGNKKLKDYIEKKLKNYDIDEKLNCDIEDKLNYYKRLISKDKKLDGLYISRSFLFDIKKAFFVTINDYSILNNDFRYLKYDLADYSEKKMQEIVKILEKENVSEDIIDNFKCFANSFIRKFLDKMRFWSSEEIPISHKVVKLQSLVKLQSFKELYLNSSIFPNNSNTFLEFLEILKNPPKLKVNNFSFMEIFMKILKDIPKSKENNFSYLTEIFMEIIEKIPESQVESLPYFFSSFVHSITIFSDFIRSLIISLPDNERAKKYFEEKMPKEKRNETIISILNSNKMFSACINEIFIFYSILFENIEIRFDAKLKSEIFDSLWEKEDVIFSLQKDLSDLNKLGENIPNILENFIINLQKSIETYEFSKNYDASVGTDPQFSDFSLNYCFESDMLKNVENTLKKAPKECHDNLLKVLKNAVDIYLYGHFWRKEEVDKEEVDLKK